MKEHALLYGIGVGPGDPELITIKAIRCIKESDVLIFPAKDKYSCIAYDIVGKSIEQLDNKKLIFIPFPMIMVEDELKKFHEEVAKEIEIYLQNNLTVAFLTIGDPTIYSTFGYINELLCEKYKVEIISGISSINAVAAKLGISLAEGNECIHIVPGSADIKQSLDLPGTKVYMKSGKRLNELLQLLNEEKKYKNIKITAVSECGRNTEKVCKNLEEIPKDGKYLTTIIVK